MNSPCCCKCDISGSFCVCAGTAREDLGILLERSRRWALPPRGSWWCWQRCCLLLPAGFHVTHGFARGFADCKTRGYLVAKRFCKTFLRAAPSAGERVLCSLFCLSKIGRFQPQASGAFAVAGSCQCECNLRHACEQAHSWKWEDLH